MNKSARFSLLTTTIVVGALCAGTWRAAADTYVQTDLVSDLTGVGADITDSALVNPWGVSHSATSTFWISNQGTNTATLYSVTGSATSSTNVSKVNINPPSGFVAIFKGGVLGAVKLSGAETRIERAAVRDFRASLKGTLLTPADADYEAARHVGRSFAEHE